jgi:hypothetical protein
MPTRALLTDVGNDILYGYSPDQILVWVEEAIDRLERWSTDIVIAGLPRVGLRDISPAKFMFFRSILFPRCRLTFPEVAEAAAVVNDGLAAIARARGARFVPLKRDWYGIDPIHIRPSSWQPAWREILCGEPLPGRDRLPFVESCSLYFLRPERQRIFGVECGVPQQGVRLSRGGRVWLF